MTDATAETWYIAGPMRGYPDFNYPLFAKVAETLRRDPALTVLNPAENFCGDTTRDFADYMRQDLTQLMSADVVLMLPGWQDSNVD